MKLHCFRLHVYIVPALDSPLTVCQLIHYLICVLYEKQPNLIFSQEIKKNLEKEYGKIDDSVQHCPLIFGKESLEISLDLPPRPVCGGWMISQRNPNTKVKCTFLVLIIFIYFYAFIA